MCRLLSIYSNNKEESAEILGQFKKLAHFGMVPADCSYGHCDGWGIVRYRRGKIIAIEKEPEDAFSSARFKKVEQGIGIDRGDIVVAHLRKASVGKKNISNTHPFVRGSYSFCHNGKIVDSQNIPLASEFKKLIKGTTDSEIFFVYVLQILNTYKKPNAAAITNSIKKAIGDIRKRMDFSAMNIIFSDGKNIWALREVNLKNEYVKKEKLKDYYSLFVGKSKESALICSEKVKARDVKWTAIKNHHLVMMDAKKSIFDTVV